MHPNPTLDQLQVFIAVAETGSFSAAARQLNRAQSVISYTIGNLEAQLQLTLLDRSGSRHPVLTDAGRSILDDARRMIADLDILRARSKALNDGLEGEVKLAVSVMVPDALLVEVLAQFQVEFPTVLLRLTVGAPFLVTHLVEQGGVDIGIGGNYRELGNGMAGERIGLSFMAPVAAPQHRLSRLGRTLNAADVRDEIQIVVSDTTGMTEGKDFNVISRRTWRVSDMGTKRDLLLGGLGWGGLPLSMIRTDLAEGRLVLLDVEPYDSKDYPITAMWAAGRPPGPAARWIADRMAQYLGRCPGSLEGALEKLEDHRIGNAASHRRRMDVARPSAEV